MDVQKLFLETAGQTSLFLDHTTSVRCSIKPFITGSWNGLLEGLVQPPGKTERLLANLSDHILSHKYTKLDANSILILENVISLSYF